jgi:hypothetical protein
MVPASPWLILQSSLIAGYLCWSMYWGLPPWAWLIAQDYKKTPKVLVGAVGGCFITVGWITLAALIILSLQFP